MKTAVKLIVVAFLALSVGVAYASPMLINPQNVKPFPRVPEGPKAEFNVDVVYAKFNTHDYIRSQIDHDMQGNPQNNSYPSTDINYQVVLNVTNLSDKPATMYELAFAAAQGFKTSQSIQGGTIYAVGLNVESSIFPSYVFGGIVDGVYLDGKWTNITWIPEGRYLPNGSWQSMPYPDCLIALQQANWYNGIITGPLNPNEVRNFSANHALNSTVPNLPANATESGVWFEGVPIAEYYSLSGQPLITEMYINGSWVDLTGRVTVDNPQPFTVVSGEFVNSVMTVGAMPYENWANSTVGPLTGLPHWGSWNNGRAYRWLPFSPGPAAFNNIWAPHESRLIMFNNTEMFSYFNSTESPRSDTQLQAGTLKLFASASNYLNNWPVNGTYYNTVSTATSIAQLHFDKTADGYVYNGILADNQTFQQGKSAIEVIIAPRTKP
jgi:hypothetical protein